MFKRFFILLVTAIFLTGCMPSPVTDTHKNRVHQTMITRSLTNSGNSFRLNKKLKALKKGDNFLIAFVGSSVFVEDEDGNSIAKNSFEQIKELLSKKVNPSMLNFSIFGINSELGNIMLTREVLSKKPDVIFLDFAVFDGKEQEDRENFESIVRACLNQENEPQVIIFLNSQSANVQKQDFMEQIAKYYNLPVIDVSTAFMPEFSSGRMKPEEIFIENNNGYTDLGKQFIADFCKNYFEKVIKVKTDKDYIVPPSMYPNLTAANPKFVDAANIQAENDGSYIRVENKNNEFFKSRIEYLTNTENIPFIFITEANNIYLVAPVSQNRNDVFEILINGKKTKEFSTYSDLINETPKSFKIFSSNKVEKVAVAIKLKQEENVSEDTVDENFNKQDSADNQNTKSDRPQKDFEFWGFAYTKN